MSTIFVAGATGLTGANVCEKLMTRGDEVRALVRALDRSVAGEQYWLIGRPENQISTQAGCIPACEIAGVDHRVDDLDYRSDPEALTETFGPTLMAIAEAAATEVRTPRSADNPTAQRLRYTPMSLDEGLAPLIAWMRQIGKI